MPPTPPEFDNVTDLAAFRAQMAARLAEDGLDRDAMVRSMLGEPPERSWPEPAGKPLPLHPERTAPALFRVRVELVDSTPPIWRGLELPADLGLEALHDVLQAAFGFTNSHLHRFALTEDPFAHEYVGILTPFDVAEGDIGVPESELRIDQLLATPGDSLLYTYDFGDSWEHLITLEAVEPLDEAAVAVRCVAGARRGPVEDVGGVPGWEELLELAASGAVPSYSEKGQLLRTLGLIDVVDEVDLDEINRALRRVAGAAAALDRLRAQPVGPKGPSALAALVAKQSQNAQAVLAGYLAAADLSRPIEPGEAEAATAVIRAFLGLVGEGIRLTDAGYLTPTAVKAIMAAMDVDRRWRGPANREVQTYPVLQMRDIATQLGLTRKFKGELRLTTRGRALLNDPVGLASHLASRLPVEKTPVGSEMALLLLLLVAADEAHTMHDVRERIDLLSAMIGWEYSDSDGRYGNLFALQDAFDTTQVLQWAGSGTLIPPRGLDANGLDTPAARMLARAALATWD